MDLSTRRRAVPEAAGRPRGLSLTPALLGALLGALLSGQSGAQVGEPPLLIDVTARLAVTFEHRHYGTGEKYMPENMGAGVAVFDYDGDGALDLYFVQGAPVVVADTIEVAPNQLFRQREDGRFEDVTERAGVGDRGVGMGVAVGDYDGDGAPDVYVTNYGVNVLFRNRGDGSFEDVTAKAGVGGSSWSTGAAFVDLDEDGDLDLYAAAYLTYDPADDRFCGNAQTGVKAYCHPDVYGGQTDTLYLNEGDGTFRDASLALGLVEGDEARGLGVAALDLTGDGAIDVYVANDTTANHLYARGGDGRLAEGAWLAGVAVNGAGKGEASMGIAAGDFDADGRRELFLTHLDKETNTLYRPLAPGVFADATERSGLGVPSLPWVGFGAVAVDLELDGDLDLLVTNGHIIDNIAEFAPGLVHAQPFQLLRNDRAGLFTAQREGLGVDGPLVGRGLASGDLDRDGDADLVLTQNGGAALILDNAVDTGRSASLSVRHPLPSSWGTRWEISTGEHRQVRWLHRAPSYLSQSAAEIIFGVDVGVGAADAVDVERRPRRGRAIRYLRLAVGRRYVLPAALHQDVRTEPRFVGSR